MGSVPGSDVHQGELNRLFSRTYVGTDIGMGGSWAWEPPLDVYETPDKLVVSVELAGIDPKDVEVSLEDSTLTISGTREFHSDVSEESFHRVERRSGSFQRSLSLPSTANPEGIEASFDKGVLTVEVPRGGEAKPKKIRVKAKG